MISDDLFPFLIDCLFQNLQPLGLAKEEALPLAERIAVEIVGQVRTIEVRQED
jgi:hypothetical protein